MLQPERVIGVSQEKHCPRVQLVREQELGEQATGHRLNREAVGSRVAIYIAVLDYRPEKGPDVQLLYHLVVDYLALYALASIIFKFALAFLLVGRLLKIHES